MADVALLGRSLGVQCCVAASLSGLHAAVGDDFQAGHTGSEVIMHGRTWEGVNEGSHQ